MNDQPLVSVILTVYNDGKFLVRFLDSLIHQTLRNIEIICVNDGSSDDSHDILEEYSRKDKRIRVFHQENRGANPARNLGLEQARGVYLSVLDADDFFAPEMLEESSGILEKEKSDIAVFAAYSFSDRTGEIKKIGYSLQTEFLPEERPFKPIRMKDRLLNAFQNWTWNKVFRKSFIDENHIIFQDVKRTTDMAFTLEALVKAGSISVIDKPLAYYRVDNPESLQATNHLAPLAFWDAYTETQRRIRAAGVYDVYEKSFLNHVLSGCIFNMDSNKTDFGRLYVACHLKYNGEAVFGFLRHGRDYYYDKRSYDIYTDIVNSDTPRIVKNLQDQYDEVIRSTAFRIGSVLTYVPGTIKRKLLPRKKQA